MQENTNMSHRVVYYIDSNNFGGAEQVLYTILKGLDRNEWHPILAYHPSPGIMPFIKIVEKLEVETLSILKIRSYHDISRILRFISRLRSIRPAIFHANINWPLSCSYGIISAYLSHIHTIIATQHLYQEIGSRRHKILQKLISLMVDSYIAISADLANQLNKTVSCEEKIKVIQNGIDLEYYSGRGNEKIDGNIYAPFNKDNLPVILTVARLAKQKGHIYMLKAATKIRKAVFVFVGDGPERPNLEKEARELNLTDRVIFLGERNDIPDLLSACDVYVQPSIFEGGLALSIMEAMAACKPVIATDVEGVSKNVINGENILLVPPADPEALAQATSTLISDKTLAKSIAASGKYLVYNKFSAKRMINELSGLYMKLLAREQSAYQQ